jgi:hypothetical protein
VQENQRDDREWEHWPGRRTGDDRIRDRLKALFSATDSEEDLEALIVERGLEIEKQTERLQATIADLERREEQTGQLRSSVEEMLRNGSAELDERHAELSALAADLKLREERVRADERDIAVRKQELGAVELRRAAVERREEALRTQEGDLERSLADLADRERQLAEAQVLLARDVEELAARLRAQDEREAARKVAELAPPPLAADHASHLLYFVDHGYRIRVADGPAPALDSGVEIDGRPLVVARLARSPLPGDGRACAYLEPAAARA